MVHLKIIFLLSKHKTLDAASCSVCNCNEAITTFQLHHQSANLVSR